MLRRAPPTTFCHTGRKRPRVAGSTGSTSLRRAASERRRSRAEHLGVAPLGARAGGPELALEHPALRGQPGQRLGGDGDPEAEALRRRRRA